jgi:hypothetical protein
MAKAAESLVRFTLKYDGLGPVYWVNDPAHFGIQDKDGVLHQGRTDKDGVVAFDFALELKPGTGGAPVFTGEFAHGSPAERFLYLGWRNTQMAFAQRLKIPLSPISRDDVEKAQTTGRPLVATVIDKTPKAATTGANIGGTRAVTWTVGEPS